jgi:hypothetical protein
MVTDSQPRYQRMSEFLNSPGKDEDLLTALETFIDVYKEEKLKKESPRIQLSLFANRNLGALEIVVKCLKENLEFNYSKIAELLGRDQRTIWATYRKASSKEKQKFTIIEENHSVPISIFSNRTLGPLEALTIYLKDESRMSFNQISTMLNRNYRTIWLSYQNALKKQEGRKGEKKNNEQERSNKKMV